MNRLKLFSVFILVLVCAVACSAQKLRAGEDREKILVPRVFQNSRGEKLLYRVFIPSNYDAKKKYPVVLYLHGGGGRGTDNRQQIDGGNGYLIDFFTGDEAQASYPSFVVAPQSPMQEGWIESDSITPTRQLRLVYEMLGELQKTYSIDSSRIHVSGQSMAAWAPLRSLRSIRLRSQRAWPCVAAATLRKSRG